MQDLRDFRVVISDQNDDRDVASVPEVQAVTRVLQLHGYRVDIHKHLPRRGMAEQRQFLLDRSTEPYALFLDDDLILEPDVSRRMLSAIRAQQCGFVGCPVIGLSYAEDVRDEEQNVDFWDGPIEPEDVRPGTRGVGALPAA